VSAPAENTSTWLDVFGLPRDFGSGGGAGRRSFRRVEWVRDFYTRTGTWWGPAEAKITDRDLRRVDVVERFAGPAPCRILELGCGYGTTVSAAAIAGYTVTGVEVSDRADFAAQLPTDSARARIVKDDFYAIQLNGTFDVVCYWNGFGVGSDPDQRRLLGRIASEWLTPDGLALIDIANPFVWARWDGDEDSREPRPDAGYEYSLRERTTYDPIHNRALDTWWETDTPEQSFSQSIRCYTPADLSLLLEGTGLALANVVLGDRTIDQDAPHPGLRAFLEDQHEYLAVLRRAR
jgi:SAM-dependent methyltransferase